VLRGKVVLQDGENPLVNRALSPYDKMLLACVAKEGGFYNAHAHLDRADTVLDEYLGQINTTPLDASFLPLSVKQNLTGDLHRGTAYTEEDLRERIMRVIERLITYGTKGLATCIDVTPDLPEDGMLAWRVAKELQQEFADRIVIKLGPNPIFGFKEISRWEVFEKAADQADFLSCLPEKDDSSELGYQGHIRRVMELACKLGKEVHIHVDQANDPQEKGAKTIIEGLGWIDQPKIGGQSAPAVWLIHCISPSAYSENEFAEVIQGLLDYNLGVIVCPTAALSMRQYRPIMSPTHNCIARVLELLKSKVPILIGSDNIADVFVPASDGDILTELKVLAHAVRFPIPHILAKLGAGVSLNNVDRAKIGEALYQERKAYREIDPNWSPCVD